MELRGRVALVTGSAKRLGRAMATELAERGTHIAVHYRSSEREALDTVAALQALGVTAQSFQADLTHEEQVRALMAGVETAFGRLDILVNSAAGFDRTPFAEVDATTWRKTMDVNLTSVFLCSRYAAPLLRAGEGGSLVNISDTAAWSPWPDYLPYSVSKAGVIALTQGLAKALAPQVRVNCIALGTVLPPESLDAREWEAKMAAKTLVGHIGDPGNVIQSLLYCLECDYLTGAVLPLDGGRFLRGQEA